MRVIGYAADAEIVCKDCLRYPVGAYDREGNPVTPVTEDEEVDAPLHCGACGAFLGGRLTADGERYVRERVLRGDGRPEVLRAWREAYWYLFE